MENRMRVTRHHQRNWNVSRCVTPEMRQQIFRLRRQLEACERRLAEHLYVLDEVREALKIAQKCAHCLLTDDPFAAWERLSRRKQKEFDEIFDIEDSAEADKQLTTHRQVKGN